MAVKKKSAAKPTTEIYQDAFQRAINNQKVNPVSAPPIPGQTPELTAEEERLFGVYVNPAGQIVPGVRPTATVAPIVSGSKPITTPQTTEATNQIYILINKLKTVGIPAATADRAGVFFASLLDDGITDLDNAVDIFLNTRSYKSKKTGQEIPSPYYTDFGKFNDKLSSAKPPGVLVPWILGIKDTLKKYNPGSLYETDDSIQKYLMNDVKVSDLDERFNAARLRSITADKAYVDALIQLKFINKPEDLTGFFASPEIGQKQLELNRNTGALAAEAVRRAQVGGLQLDTEFAKQQGAALTAKGYSEGQVSAIAEKNYQQIARNIMPTVKVSGIYQGAQAATAGTIQSELQQQEFMGMDSQRYEMLAEQEARSFQGSAGNIRSPRISSYRDDITGQI